MGHHHGHPLTGAMGLRPDHHANSVFANPANGTPSHIITMPHWYQPFHVSCRTHAKLII